MHSPSPPLPRAHHRIPAPNPRQPTAPTLPAAASPCRPRSVSCSQFQSPSDGSSSDRQELHRFQQLDTPPSSPLPWDSCPSLAPDLHGAPSLYVSFPLPLPSVFTPCPLAHLHNTDAQGAFFLIYITRPQSPTPIPPLNKRLIKYHYNARRLHMCVSILQRAQQTRSIGVRAETYGYLKRK